MFSKKKLQMSVIWIFIFMLSWVEHEKSFTTAGADIDLL